MRAALLAYTTAHPSATGVHPTDVPGLHLIRGDRETPLRHSFYEPALIAVVQGAKEVVLGDARFTYAAGAYMIMSVGLPVLAAITDADAERPYLALSLTIDRGVLRELVDEMGGGPGALATGLGLFVGTLDARQSGALGRLADLLSTPDALRVLAGSIAREVIFWTLRGRDGAAVCSLAMPDSHVQRIGAAIAAMRKQPAEAISIERLAAIAHMSPSSFHQHFKVVTSMSPLQFHKQLRLLEARRLMLSGTADATRAAYEVGYESTSQFSREYARFFGAPPRRDVRRVTDLLPA